MRRAALKDIARLLAGNVSAKALGVIGLMFFTRILSTDELALFPIFFMVNGLLDTLFSFGVCPAFVRTLPAMLRDDLPKARSLILSGSLVMLGGVSCAAILMFLFANSVAEILLHDPSAASLIQLISLGAVFYAICILTDYIMWCRGQFTADSVVQVIEAISRPIGAGLGFIAFGKSGLVIGLIASQVIVMGASLYCLRDLISGGWPQFYPSRDLFRQSIPLYFDSLLWYLRGDGDNLLIAALLGPSHLAIYYVAKILFSNVLVVLTSLDRVVHHRLAQISKDTASLSVKINELQSHLARLAIPLIMLTISLTPALITILAGPSYQRASLPAILLLLAAMVQFMTIPIDRSVLIALPPVFRLYKTSAEVVSVFVSAIILMPTAGIAGLAAARLSGQTMGGLFGLAVLKRKLSITLSYAQSIRVLIAAMPGTFLILAFHAPLDTALNAALSAVVSGSVWLSLFLFFIYFIDRNSFCWGYATIVTMARVAMSGITGKPPVDVCRTPHN